MSWSTSCRSPAKRRSEQPPTGADVRCVRGTMTFEIEVAPRFDYGRQSHPLTTYDDGAVFHAGATALTLSAVREPREPECGRRPGKTEATCAPRCRSRPVRSAGSCWRRHRRRHRASFAPARGRGVSSTTRWRSGRTGSASRPIAGGGARRCSRSAITLKLMTYAPTGGLRRGADGGAARADRRRAQLGLPLHLGARRVVLGRTRCSGMGFVEEAASVRRVAARSGAASRPAAGTDR